MELSAKSDDATESFTHRIIYRYLTRFIEAMPDELRREFNAQLDKSRGNGSDSLRGGSPWMAPDSGLGAIETDEDETGG